MGRRKDAEDARNVKDIKSLLSRFREKLEQDLRVERIIPFGSRASGTGHEYSDVDLIIVSPGFEDKGYFERAAMMYDYWESDLPVDFLCYTPGEFRSFRQRATIIREAAATGVEA